MGARVGLVIGGLLLVGIILRLLSKILEPVLPGFLMQALSGGWGMLLGILSPALPAIAAVAILAAVCWVVVARR